MVVNLIRKEMRELLTRTTVGYMVVMALILLFTGRTISSSTEQAAANAIVAIVDLDDGEYSDVVVDTLNQGARVAYTGGAADEGIKALESQGGAALVTIPADFSRAISGGRHASVEITWLMNGTGALNSMPLSIIEGLMETANRAVARQILANKGDPDPGVTLRPMSYTSTTILKGRPVPGVSPGQVNGLIGARAAIVPVAIMMLIIMGSSSVISSMGTEKENKTLETLLTMPVRRSSIILGKVAGSAIAGLIMGAVYMIGFSGYIGSFGGAAGSSLAELGLALNGGDYALVALSVFFALMAALSLSIVMGTFADNLRSAQTFTFPIVGLAMFVMMTTTFQDIDTMPLILKTAVFLIPFSHPMMAMNALMMDNYTLVVGGILYSMAFTAAAVAAAVWIFNSDRLLTGRMALRRKRY